LVGHFFSLFAPIAPPDKVLQRTGLRVPAAERLVRQAAGGDPRVSVHKRPKEYIPAAGRDWLLPLYDPVLRFVMRERTFKRRLIEQARLPDAGSVLDLGCGTGTLTIMLKHAVPRATVRGLDGDPKALQIAELKSERAGVEIPFDRGLAYDLAYPDDTFDRVLSSLLFHHLSREHKRETLAEVARVLRPGGSLHIVDFGPPRSVIGKRLAGLVVRGEPIRDNIEGRLLPLLRDVFPEATESGRQTSVTGVLVFYQAVFAR
jgi:ubiquinone/menaquinone biosynthesis C-methylase UbiE